MGSRPETQLKLLDSLHRLPRAAAIELTESGLTYDAAPSLRGFPGPRFAIVTPENDGPLSLHRAVPGFRHAVIAGSGHWIQLDQPREFSQVLDGFLGR